MAQWVSFDRGPTVSSNGQQFLLFLAGDGRGNKAERGGRRPAQGWMQTMVRGPEIQDAEKLLDRTPWGLRLWPLAGHE